MILTGTLCFGLPPNDCPRYGKTLSSVSFASYLYYPQVSNYSKNLSHHRCFMVYSFYLRCCFRVFTNSLKLGAGNPSPLWKSESCPVVCSRAVDPYRLCHLDSSLVCDQQLAATRDC